MSKPTELAVSIINDLVTKRKASFETAHAITPVLVLVETLTPFLERIATAFEAQAGITKGPETAVSTPTSAVGVDERFAEEQARTQRAIQAADEVHLKYKESLETITQLKDRLRMVGLPV